VKLTIIPAYEPITEKEYCCVPAVLQMIQGRRGLGYESQEEIGYQLGLIVPPEFERKFSKVRTGPEPQAGYGTQTSKEEFSIPSYFRRNGLPLKFTIIRPQTVSEFRHQLCASLQAAADVIICYNSHLLFGDGDVEHVSLIQEFDAESGDLVVVDPAIGVPKLRKTTVDHLFKVINAHDVSNHGGLWTVSAMRSNTHENQK
jgi:hypothetical protein